MLADLARQGARLEALNVERLCREMEERGGADPWTLDLEGLAAALARTADGAGAFRVTSIRAAAGREVELPVEGAWFPESPFRRPVAAEEGRLRLRLAAGGLPPAVRSGGETADRPVRRGGGGAVDGKAGGRFDRPRGRRAPGRPRLSPAGAAAGSGSAPRFPRR